jgi:hypothetical protein
MEQKSGYSKARNIFLVLFLLSTGVALVLTIFNSSLIIKGPGVSGDVRPDAMTIGGLVAIVSSCVTSMVAFLGFVSTTVLAWRKEAREKEDRELEKRQKEIELEKARFELEKMQGEERNQPPN